MANIPITKNEERAWNFAKELHKTQVRKFSGIPYFDAHVQKVNGIVKQYTRDEATLIAALLHDTIEDCFDDIWEAYAIIKKEFGQEVADIVMELTSDNNVIKHKFNNSKTKYLTNKMLGMSEKALVVKLSDRLQNISDAFTASEKFRTAYFLETVSIINSVEKGRDLSRIHQQLINEIKGKLRNINNIFKIKRFREIK